MAAPNLADAQARERVRLAYQADGLDCPGEQTFRDIVAGRLGYDPFAADAPRLLRVVLERETGRLDVVDAAGRSVGSRELDADASSCVEVAESMAIAIALVLDPLGVHAVEAEPEPEPEVAPEPPAPELPTREPEPPPPAITPTTPESPPRFVARASAVVGYGSLPGPSLGPWLGLGVRVGAWTVLAEGGADLLLAQSEGGPDRLDVQAVSGGPTGCVQIELFQGCAGLQLGALLARAPDLAEAATKTDLFGAVELRAGVEIPLLDALAFSAGLELRIPWFHTALAIDGDPIWQASPVAGRLHLGLVLSIS